MWYKYINKSIHLILDKYFGRGTELSISEIKEEIRSINKRLKSLTKYLIRYEELLSNKEKEIINDNYRWLWDDVNELMMFKNRLEEQMI